MYVFCSVNSTNLVIPNAGEGKGSKLNAKYTHNACTSTKVTKVYAYFGNEFVMLISHVK